jgi:2-hydroxy-3-keto-5-methylthiopentenyl-1-phosphate phosphatase
VNAPLHLDRAAVFLDFDGTITTVDSCLHLLERLGTPEWHDAEVLYSSGAIGSREASERQWSTITAERSVVEEVAREVSLDAGFEALVEFLERAGARTTIVSDGFGILVDEVARRTNLEVVSNRVDWSTRSIVFPEVDPTCECGRCGTCKRAPIRQAKGRGLTTVLVGDGTSDTKAATEADLVFAKGSLASWCDENSIPYRLFETLQDVQDQLETLANG